jgi:transposase
MSVMTDENREVRRARRSFPARYKLDILEEIDQAKLTGGPGAVGEICRREDLYSSLITEWRKQRDAGALRGLTDAKRGRKAKDPTKAEMARLRAEVTKLEERLDTANELIEAQGKVSALLGKMSRRSAEPNTRQP